MEGDSMKPHQDRVVSEKAELDERIRKLEAFMGDRDLFRPISEAEQKRMSRQLAHMKDYSNVLTERIAAFHEA